MMFYRFNETAKGLRMQQPEESSTSESCTFGEEVRFAREKHGLSLTQLAKKLGITKGYLSRIELNQVPPPSYKILWNLTCILELDMKAIQYLLETSPISYGTLKEKYRGFIDLLRKVIGNMNDQEIEATFGRLEERLAMFEDPADLIVDTFKKFLLRKIGYSEDPENGGRPISHYFEDWSEKLDSWEAE